MRIFISAGEASGDALGASLIRALRARVPDIEVFGMGGPRMSAEGFRAVKDARELNVMGLFEVVRHLPRLFRLLAELAQAAIDGRPDAAVLIDAPDFNVRLAKRLTLSDIPVAFYVGPSVWAWRPGRVHRFKRWIRRMMVLFPFEIPIWEKAGVDAVCVGHPLRDQIRQPAEAAQREPRTVALLPGSRRTEVRRHLPIMLQAAAKLRAEGLADHFLLPVAPSLDSGWLKSQLEGFAVAPDVQLISAESEEGKRGALARASVALVTSGTATLEAALVGCPQVIFYRVSWLTYLVGRLMMRVKHFGLPNIIAGREVAPELIQHALTAERLAAEARRLLPEGDARAAAIEGIRQVRERLGPPGAAERAADTVLEMLKDER